MTEPSYNILRSWTLTFTLPSAEIGSFCHALEQVTSVNGGASWYEPAFQPGLTRCRYEWFLRLAGQKRGIRITIVFSVGAQDLQELNVALTLGPQLSDHPELITANVIRRVEIAYRRAIELAADIMNGDALVERNALVHLSVPSQHLLPAESHSNCLVMFPSAQERPNGQRMIAVSVPTQTYSPPSAHIHAQSLGEKLSVALSILVGQRFSLLTSIRWPKNRSGHHVWARDLNLRDAYPGRLYRVDHSTPEGFKDFTTHAGIALQMISSTASISDDFWTAMHALASGIALHESQPTLASVAYIAAMSSMIERSRCPGDVACSICGSQPRHYENGEVKAIADEVNAVLELNEIDAEKNRQLIRRVYGNQRSSYVHDAVLRHSELDEPGTAGASARPEGGGGQSSAVKFQEDLTNIQRLGRRFIIGKLSEQLKDANTIGNELKKEPILTSIAMTANITVSNIATGILPPFGN